MGSVSLCRFVTVSVLLCLLGISLAAYLLIPHVVDDAIRKQIWDVVVMRPGTAQDAYERFVNSTSETYLTRFYMFNITNLDAVRQNGSKPVLAEVGPYTYRTMSLKHDVHFHWNGSISYKEKTLYFRHLALTNGSFDDEIVTLNLALIGVLDRVFDRLSFKFLEGVISRAAASLSGTHQGLFLKRTVDELLFGYDEPLLKVASKFTTVGHQFKLMTNGTTESEDACGWDQITMINGGINEIDRIGQLEMWKGRRFVYNWNGYAEPVGGTAGTFFKPSLSSEEPLVIWVPDMYRSMTMEKSEEATLHGIRTFRYRISPSFWQRDDRFFQYYRGLVNITNNSAGNAQGPPVFFSNPYFCDADERLGDGVMGLSCGKEDRKFYVDVEPYTGTALRAAVRFMISSQYSNKFPAIDPNLTSTILPIFWLEMYQEATPDQTRPIRSDLYRALDMRDIMVWVSLISTILFAILVLIYGAKLILNAVRYRRRQETPQTEDRLAAVI